MSMYRYHCSVCGRHTLKIRPVTMKNDAVKCHYCGVGSKEELNGASANRG